MPQRQYPAYTQPPTTVQPAVSMGWRPSVPETVLSRTRNRQHTAFLPSSEQTQGATVFAVENWPIKLGWPQFKGPDNPELFKLRPRRDLLFPSTVADLRNPVAVPAWFEEVYPDTTTRAKLSTAQYDPWVSDIAPEDWAPAFGWPQFEGPDNPELFKWRPRRDLFPAVTGDPTTPTGITFFASYGPDATRRVRLTMASAMVDTALDVIETPAWFAAFYPDTTRRSALTVAEIPIVFSAEAIEQWARTLLATATYPDTTSRKSLTTAELPAVFRDLTIPSAIKFFASYGPYSTQKLKLATAELPFAFAVEAIEQWARKLLATATYPDTTSRKSLTTSEIQAVFKSQSPEAFRRTLLASAIYVDTTRRASLSVDKTPFIAWCEKTMERTLMESVTAPSTTSRLKLLIADIPASFRGELIENARRVLMASVTAPDTTRRNSLKASVIPYISRPEVQTLDVYLPALYPSTTHRRSLPTAMIPVYFSNPRRIGLIHEIFLLGEYRPVLYLVGGYQDTLTETGEYRPTSYLVGEYRTTVTETGEYRVSIRFTGSFDGN